MGSDDRVKMPHLHIDLSAIRRNYAALAAHCPKAQCGAVVKADAYGLGMAPIARALAEAGCRTFFTAWAEEALALREHQNSEAKKLSPDIYAFHGVTAEEAEEVAVRGVRPVLNSLEQLAIWREEAHRQNRVLPAALHLDTGMNRLGLSQAAMQMLADDPSLLEGVEITLVMSHLACADTPDHPLSRAQKETFDRALAALGPKLKGAARSLANSAGILLGNDYGYDLLRPGCALYGINPRPGLPSPVEPVLTLTAPLLQLREISAGEHVGYGARFTAHAPTRIATVGLGYADGLLRHLGETGGLKGFFGGKPAPVIGRISMDLITLDVSHLPPDTLTPGMAVTFIGPGQTVDDLAAAAGTIGYEIFTRLGNRFTRRYHDNLLAAD